MSRIKEVLLSLKSSTKGKLKYDKDWPKKDIIQVWEECTVPPQLSRSADLSEKKHKTQHSVSFDESVKLTNESVSSDLDLSIDMDALVTGSRINKSICVMEREYDEDAKSRTEARKQMFDKHNRLMKQESDSRLLDLQKRRELKAALEAQEYRNTEIARSEETQRNQKNIQERHRKHAMSLTAKMEEARRKQEEEEKRRKQVQEENKERQVQLETQLREIITYKDQATTLYTSCTHKEHLSPESANIPATVVQYTNKLQEIVSRTQQSIPQGRDVQQGALLLKTVKELVMALMKDINAARAKYDETKKKEEQQKKEQDEKKAKELEEKKKKESEAKAQTVANISVPKEGEVLCVTPDGLKWYLMCQKQLHLLQNAVEALKSDPNMKKPRFELQKGVNTIINTISPSSGSHLKEKINQIISLLDGHSIEVGNKRVVATDDNLKNFCRNLICKKIVEQAQVSTNKEQTFAIAAVAVTVWAKHPDVGPILMAYFHQKCPYLVPYYLPKKEGMTNEQYYESLGYNYNNGKVEEQNLFLDRMSAISRLYGSILISAPQIPNSPHPHGIDQGWIWLCRLINVDPRPDISATMILSMLETTGSSLYSTYNAQFKKLLQVTISDYVPRVRNCGGSGGPVTRLEGYLDKCVRTGSIAPPEGSLSQRFWNT